MLTASESFAHNPGGEVHVDKTPGGPAGAKKPGGPAATNTPGGDAGAKVLAGANLPGGVAKSKLKPGGQDKPGGPMRPGGPVNPGGGEMSSSTSSTTACTPGGPTGTAIDSIRPGGAPHGLNSMARGFNASATIVLKYDLYAKYGSTM